MRRGVDDSMDTASVDFDEEEEEDEVDEEEMLETYEVISHEYSIKRLVKLCHKIDGYKEASYVPPGTLRRFSAELADAVCEVKSFFVYDGLSSFSDEVADAIREADRWFEYRNESADDYRNHFLRLCVMRNKAKQSSDYIGGSAEEEHINNMRRKSAMNVSSSITIPIGGEYFETQMLEMTRAQIQQFRMFSSTSTATNCLSWLGGGDDLDKEENENIDPNVNKTFDIISYDDPSMVLGRIGLSIRFLPKSPALYIFNEYDFDHDGSLSRSEFQAFVTDLAIAGGNIDRLEDNLKYPGRNTCLGTFFCLTAPDTDLISFVGMRHSLTMWAYKPDPSANTDARIEERAMLAVMLVFWSIAVNCAGPGIMDNSSQDFNKISEYGIVILTDSIGQIFIFIFFMLQHNTVVRKCMFASPESKVPQSFQCDWHDPLESMQACCSFTFKNCLQTVYRFIFIWLPLVVTVGFSLATVSIFIYYQLWQYAATFLLTIPSARLLELFKHATVWGIKTQFGAARETLDRKSRKGNKFDSLNSSLMFPMLVKMMEKEEREKEEQELINQNKLRQSIAGAAEKQDEEQDEEEEEQDEEEEEDEDEDDDDQDDDSVKENGSLEENDDEETGKEEGIEKEAKGKVDEEEKEKTGTLSQEENEISTVTSNENMDERALENEDDDGSHLDPDVPPQVVLSVDVERRTSLDVNTGVCPKEEEEEEEEAAEGAPSTGDMASVVKATVDTSITGSLDLTMEKNDVEANSLSTDNEVIQSSVASNMIEVIATQQSSLAQSQVATSYEPSGGGGSSLMSIKGKKKQAKKKIHEKQTSKSKAKKSEKGVKAEASLSGSVTASTISSLSVPATPATTKSEKAAAAAASDKEMEDNDHSLSHVLQLAYHKLVDGNHTGDQSDEQESYLPDPFGSLNIAIASASQESMKELKETIMEVEKTVRSGGKYGLSGNVKTLSKRSLSKLKKLLLQAKSVLAKKKLADKYGAIATVWPRPGKKLIGRRKNVLSKGIEDVRESINEVRRASEDTGVVSKVNRLFKQTSSIYQPIIGDDPLKNDMVLIDVDEGDEEEDDEEDDDSIRWWQFWKYFQTETETEEVEGEAAVAMLNEASLSQLGNVNKNRLSRSGSTSSSVSGAGGIELGLLSGASGVNDYGSHDNQSTSDAWGMVLMHRDGKWPLGVKNEISSKQCRTDEIEVELYVVEDRRGYHHSSSISPKSSLSAAEFRQEMNAGSAGAGAGAGGDHAVASGFNEHLVLKEEEWTELVRYLTTGLVYAFPLNPLKDLVRRRGAFDKQRQSASSAKQKFKRLSQQDRNNLATSKNALDAKIDYIIKQGGDTGHPCVPDCMV